MAKYILMNKNTKVLSAEYDSGTGIFTYIYEVYNINYAPYILEKIYNKDLDDEDFFVKKINVYTEAQVVLNSPVTKAMDGLFALTMGLGGTEDGD